jgi:hypothetical protein
MHPEIALPPDVLDFVNNFKRDNPGVWREAQSQTRDLADAWDARIRLMEDPASLQQEMGSLAARFSEIRQTSILERYGFVPARATSYLTDNFLHAGWLHLIGNM